MSNTSQATAELPKPAEWALQLAAQAWCEPTTSAKVMDEALATVFAQILTRLAASFEADRASRAGSEPVAWPIPWITGTRGIPDLYSKHQVRTMLASIAPAAAAEPSELTTCNCRWKGEKLVQQCTLHEAWRDAIRDWSERAKVAERQLPDRARAASLVAGLQDLHDRMRDGPFGASCVQTKALLRRAIDVVRATQ